jgi:hypothetical protein
MPGRITILPTLSGNHSLYKAEKYKAYPEIQQHSEINPRRHVTGLGRQKRQQQEIEGITRQNRHESLKEVCHS